MPASGKYPSLFLCFLPVFVVASLRLHINTREAQRPCLYSWIYSTNGWVKKKIATYAISSCAVFSVSFSRTAALSTSWWAKKNIIRWLLSTFLSRVYMVVGWMQNFIFIKKKIIHLAWFIAICMCTQIYIHVYTYIQGWPIAWTTTAAAPLQTFFIHCIFFIYLKYKNTYNFILNMHILLKHVSTTRTF